MLMEAATGPGEGQPAVLRLNHTYETLDAEKGVISFTNGTSVQHDIVIGADGVGVSDNSIVYPVWEEPAPRAIYNSILRIVLCTSIIWNHPRAQASNRHLLLLSNHKLRCSAVGPLRYDAKRRH
jgi:hypothetical protein